MKKQIIQVLWSIANGVGQKQNEKIVYPSIREQLSAIKTLMSIKGWEEELLVLQQSIFVQQNSMDNQEILRLVSTHPMSSQELCRKSSYHEWEILHVLTLLLDKEKIRLLPTNQWSA